MADTTKEKGETKECMVKNKEDKVMEDIQNKSVYVVNNDYEEELVFKLTRGQAREFIYMAMLGIQASNWYTDCIGRYADKDKVDYDDIYRGEICHIDYNIDEVKAVIDEMMKVVGIPSISRNIPYKEGVIPRENHLISSLKKLGIFVSVECEGTKWNC